MVTPAPTSHLLNRKDIKLVNNSEISAEVEKLDSTIITTPSPSSLLGNTADPPYPTPSPLSKNISNSNPNPSRLVALEVTIAREGVNKETADLNCGGIPNFQTKYTTSRSKSQSFYGTEEQNKTGGNISFQTKYSHYQ